MGASDSKLKLVRQDDSVKVENYLSFHPPSIFTTVKTKDEQSDLLKLQNMIPKGPSDMTCDYYSILHEAPRTLWKQSTKSFNFSLNCFKKYPNVWNFYVCFLEILIKQANVKSEVVYDHSLENTIDGLISIMKLRDHLFSVLIADYYLNKKNYLNAYQNYEEALKMEEVEYIRRKLDYCRERIR